MGIFDAIFGKDSSQDTSRDESFERSGERSGETFQGSAGRRDTTSSTAGQTASEASRFSDSTSRTGTTASTVGTQEISGTTTSTGTASGSSRVSSLDAASRARLQEALGGASFAGDIGREAALDNLALGGVSLGTLTSRVAGGDAFIDDTIRQMQEAAVLNYERGEGRSLEALAQATGSKANTLVTQLMQEGRGNLATQLGGIEAQTRLQGDQQNIAAATAAMQGAGGLTGQARGLASTDIATLGDVLKGADVSSSFSETTTETSQEMRDIISNLTETGEETTDASSRESLTSLSESIEASTETQKILEAILGLVEEDTFERGAGTTRGSTDTSEGGSVIDLIGAIGGFF